MGEESDGKKTLRPEGMAYVVLLFSPVTLSGVIGYGALKSSDPGLLVFSLLMLLAAIVLFIGLAKTYVEVGIDTLTVRTFFKKPQTIALSSIKAVEQVRYFSKLPVALRLLCIHDGSEPEEITIPTKGYSEEAVRFLISYLEAD